jgi:hypothetical protein
MNNVTQGDALSVIWNFRRRRMRTLKVLAAAAIVATTVSQVQAGGFAAEVTETPVTPVVIEEPPAPRSSWGIILPLVGVAALIAIAGS